MKIQEKKTEELGKRNADLEREIKELRGTVDELKSMVFINSMVSLQLFLGLHYLFIFHTGASDFITEELCY